MSWIKWFSGSIDVVSPMRIYTSTELAAPALASWRRDAVTFCKVDKPNFPAASWMLDESLNFLRTSLETHWLLNPVGIVIAKLCTNLKEQSLAHSELTVKLTRCICAARWEIIHDQLCSTFRMTSVNGDALRGVMVWGFDISGDEKVELVFLHALLNPLMGTMEELMSKSEWHIQG